MSKETNVFQHLSREQLLNYIQLQQEQIELLKKQVAELKSQVAKLESQVAKNSTNSHKPPSSDRWKKAKPKSRREKGKRRSGGQPGHLGKTLKMVETPDEIIVHEVLVCEQCEQCLQDTEVADVVKRQVFDIPPMQLEVCEHQAEVKICPSCRQRNRAIFPPKVSAPTQYGVRVLAQAVYLNAYQLIPLSRIREWFADCMGQAVSEAVIARAVAQFSDQVSPALDAIYERLTQIPTVHFDETGFRIAGQTAWLHTACSDTLSYYTVHHKRGDEAMLDTGVLPNCHQWVVHDGWKAYFGFETVRHALCNAHHLRELEFAAEHYQATWASAMQDLLLQMKRQPDSSPSSPSTIDQFEQSYDALVKQGFQTFPIQPRPPNYKGRMAQHPVTNLLIRLRDYRSAVLAFLHHPEVPFDNNLAERDLRMMKVKQKISGGFRTWQGAEIFAAVRSYLATARKHGLSMFDAIVMALRYSPFIPAIPE